MLGAVQATIYSTVYPALPPIVIASFVNCFFFAVTLAFCRKQWVIGIVAFLVTVLVKGPVLPGQFMIPVYGLLFQAAKGSRRLACLVAGFAGAITHLLYGVLLAPLIFSVAPATAVVSFLKPYTGGFVSALAVCAIVFGLCGILSAEAGRRTGVRIRGNMNHVRSSVR
jgi:hypothetical protein